jgi:acyl-CoA oxidase
VDAAGAYSSPIPSVAQRFGTMVGGLTTGRMLIAQGAIDACKIGLTIAIRYSANRPQVRCLPACPAAACLLTGLQLSFA